MKRDMDLCRRILLVVEAFAEDGVMRDGEADWTELEKDRGFSLTACLHHVWLLEQAGLVEARSLGAGGEFLPTSSPICLTWAGHEFLAAARSETIWQKSITAVTNATGTVSLELMKRALATYGQKAVEMAIDMAGSG